MTNNPRNSFSTSHNAQSRRSTDVKRPGYQEIDAASRLTPESDQWAQFMVKVLKFSKSELWRTPAAQEAIRQNRWRSAPNPIGYVKKVTIRESLKLGLHEDTFKGVIPRSRKCPCGAMNAQKAQEAEHQCHAPGEIGAIASLKIPSAAARNESEGIDWNSSMLFDATSHDRIYPRLTARAKQAWAGIHDNAIDLLTNRYWEKHGNEVGEDWFDEYDEETDTRYLCPQALRGVSHNLLKRREPSPWESDGGLEIDWQAVAKKAGLSETVGMVLEMRHRFQWSRNQVLDFAPDNNSRLEYQAAWRQATIHKDQIDLILRSAYHPKFIKMAAPSRLAPEMKSVQLLRPLLPETEYEKIIADWNRRFSTRPRCARN